MADEEYTDATAEIQVGHLFADTVNPTSFAAFRRDENDQRLQLTGTIMPRNASGQPGVEARAMAWATLRPGLVVPVLSPVRPEINGLYMVESAGTAEDALWPSLGSRGAAAVGATPQQRTVSVGLRMLTGNSAQVVTTCWLSQTHPTAADVTLVATNARIGVPGDVVGSLPATATTDSFSPLDLVLPNSAQKGRMQIYHVTANTTTEITTTVEPFEFLAGSPRIDVLAGGVWYPCHGQPPAGFPVRVSNGTMAVELGHPGAPAIPARPGWPSVAATPPRPRALVKLTSSGAEEFRSDMVWFSAGGYNSIELPTGVTVEHADSETVRVKFGCKVIDLLGDRVSVGRQYTLVMRRGVVGAWLWASGSTSVRVQTAKTANVTDDSPSPKIIGAKNAEHAVMGQQVTTITSDPSTFDVNSLGPGLIRFEGGGGTLKTKSWASVRSRVVVW